MTLRDEVLAALDAYKAKHQHADSTIGLRAIGNPRFINRVRIGKPIYDATAYRLIAWLQANT